MENIGIFLGKDLINSGSDVLTALSLEQLYQMIINPDNEFLGLFHRLQEVRIIDKDVFKRMKTRLPYFIGASFIKNLRKSEHYIEIDYFTLDIDNYSQKELSVEDLKIRLSDDKRIALMFISPSGEGLKLLFRLEKNNLTPSEYSNFYKSFSATFGRNYGLENYIDYSTCDVSRVSFLSYDVNAFVNFDSIKVNPFNFYSEYDLFKTGSLETAQEDTAGRTLNEEIYSDILKRLNPKTPKRLKHIFVPKALELIIEPIKLEHEKYSIKLDEIVDINYGKKIRFSHSTDKAEVNIFYGKKGFSVVNSPVRGYCESLAELTVKLIEKVIYSGTQNDVPDEIIKANADVIARDINLN